jgi:uncharacterized protein (TIGR00369 family)
MTQTQTSGPADPTTRTRTFSWSDPLAGLTEMAGLTGLAQLQAMIEGRAPFPPISHLVDMNGMQAREGWIEVTMRPQEFHYNPIGTVHGGVLATLLDTAAGCAVHSTLRSGEGYTSLDLNTKFLRAVTLESGLLRCEGRVLQRGRRTALAQAELTDAAGKLVAHATSTCLIFSD